MSTEYRANTQSFKSLSINFWVFYHCTGLVRNISNGSTIVRAMTIVTVTKIKQERTKIGPLFDFFLHFSIFLLEILNIDSQLSWSRAQYSCGSCGITTFAIFRNFSQLFLFPAIPRNYLHFPQLSRNFITSCNSLHQIVGTFWDSWALLRL